ncbi:SHOCT-like domain-containing protein [Abyssisolibacter fermentans]|uniref:SHOCT-like domain-containing protein n=1 Tax=Abyssisolibacter fermentans TaxID=1766203 RepID=UPI00082ED638|nr:hypothetical protein [Abyssisolibacter fermentans]
MSKNYRDEKIQILKMIEDGKISSSDGLDLLEALNTNYYKEHKEFKTLKINVYNKDKKLKSNANIPLTILDISTKFISKYISNICGTKHVIDINKIIQAAEKDKKGKILEYWDDENEKKVEIYIE